MSTGKLNVFKVEVNIKKAESARGILYVGLKGQGFIDEVALSKEPVDLKEGKVTLTTAGHYSLTQITDVVVKIARANAIDIGPVEINKVRVYVPGRPWVGREFATQSVTVYANDKWNPVL